MHKHVLWIILSPVIRQQSCERFGWQLAGKHRSQSAKLYGGHPGDISKVGHFHIVSAAE
jgi:hypothetical protein